VQRFPADLGVLLDACAANWRGDVDEHVAPVDFSLTMWESMVGSELRSFPHDIIDAAWRRARP
jgi:hypothetical protein